METAHPLAPTRIMVDPLLGRDIGGRFVLTQRLASNGGGALYRAVQRSVGRDVAVKVLQSSAHPDEISRFLAQARTLSRIAHPNVMEVIDAGFTGDGLLYLVSGMVAGRTLADAIAAEGRFELDRLLRIAHQLCDALEAAHARSIVHGGLSPASVMLLPGDSIMVIDFAASPEGGLGDARGDLYALGVILHELATGRRLDQEWPSLPHLPRPLAALILALLSPEPGRRPQSARQVKAELVAMSRPQPPEPAREVTGIIQRPVAPVARVVPRRRRRGMAIPLQLLFGAGFGLGLGYALTVLAIKAFDLV